MKKVILSFIATTMFSVVSVANTTTLENKTENKTENKVENSEKSTNSEVENDVCTISCQMVVGDVIYTATAGNWFSSCSGAASRCEDKLQAMLE